ncbi:hypothetical protein Hanom_Chr17g01557901 [Helianthus anomalus]
MSPNGASQLSRHVSIHVAHLIRIREVSLSLSLSQYRTLHGTPHFNPNIPPSLSLANTTTKMNVPSVLIFGKDSFFLVVFFIKIYGCSLFFVNLS